MKMEKKNLQSGKTVRPARSPVLFVGVRERQKLVL